MGPNRELALRAISALVFAPPALLAIHYGAPWYDALVILVAVVMAWEWARLCGADRESLAGWALIVAVPLVVALAVAGWTMIALLAAVAASAVVWAVAAVSGRRDAAWVGAGAFAVGVPCAAAIWLRHGSSGGELAVLFLVGAVWSTDIGAYVSGKTIGGPRLAPRVSPGKTWAGLIGGAVIASVFALVLARWIGAASPLRLALLGAAIAVLGQIGDLGVSVVKRRYGKKDASNIIPGHGGVLDRMDGFLTTTPAFAAFAATSVGGETAW